MRKDRVLYATLAFMMLAGAMVPAASPLTLQNNLLPSDEVTVEVDPAVLAEKLREMKGVQALDPATGEALQGLSPTATDPAAMQEFLNGGATNAGTPGLPAAEFLRTVALAEDPADALPLALANYHAASGRAPRLDVVGMPIDQTLSFSYPAGDINGDGVDDVILNMYCSGQREMCYPGGGETGDLDSVDGQVREYIVNTKKERGKGWDCRHPWSYSSSFPFNGIIESFVNGDPTRPIMAGPPEPTDNWWDEPWYMFPNHLVAISGFNGSELWNRSMSELSYDVTKGIDTDNPETLAPWAQALIEEIARWPVEGIDNDDQKMNYFKYLVNSYVMDGLCPVDFVMGTIPDERGGENPVVYRYTIFPRQNCGPIGNGCPPNPNPPAQPNFPPRTWQGVGNVIWHEIYAVDHFTGERLWTYHDWGTYNVYGTGATIHVYANKLFLNPIIMRVPTDGVDILDNQTQEALFVQDVTFNADIVFGLAEPGASAPDTYLDSFQPRERIMRLGFMGAQDAGPLSHEHRIFEYQRTIWPDVPVLSEYGDDGVGSSPDMEQSTMPWIVNLQSYAANTLMTMTPIHWGNTPVFRAFNDLSYWHYKPCCFDVDGDNIPDVVYLMYKWNMNPRFNQDGPLGGEGGPYLVKLSMRAYSGSNGMQIEWPEGDAILDPADDKEHPKKRCIRDEFICLFYPGAVRPWTELVGDVDGDGRDDMMVHIEYRYEDYLHVVNVYSGATGKALWSTPLQRARNIFTLPLGDADKDGGNDIAVFEWEDWEYPDRTVYHFSNISVVPITVYNGATGSKIWTSVTKTFNAPIDLLFMYMNFRLNGLPDVDGDGVGDLVMDDPLYLPDLEVVHRLKYVKGTTGEKIYEISCVGTFSFVSYVGDINNDTVDDFGILNGDIIDLWMTMYNGKNGTAEWSRRIYNPRIADYTFAIPRIRTHALSNHMGNETGTSLLLNFQLEIVSNGGFRGPQTFMYPEIYWYNGTGNQSWGLPDPAPIFTNSLVKGVTTGTLAYQNAFKLATKPTGAAVTAKEVAVAAAPWAGLFGLAFLSSLPVAKFQPWRTKKGE